MSEEREFTSRQELERPLLQASRHPQWLQRSFILISRRYRELFHWTEAVGARS
jgi:hypothetical protein